MNERKKKEKKGREKSGKKKRKKKKGKVEEIILKKSLEKPTFYNYRIPPTTTLLTFFEIIIDFKDMFIKT